MKAHITVKAAGAHVDSQLWKKSTYTYLFIKTYIHVFDAELNPL